MQVYDLKMKKIWFVRKRYGWGWTPATWEGWSVMLIYFILTVLLFRRANIASYSENDAQMSFLLPFILLTTLLLVVTYWRGESPRWQWGTRDTNTK